MTSLVSAKLGASTLRRQNVILMRGIDPTIPVEKLDAVLKQFKNGGLPLSCIVRTSTFVSDPLVPDSPMAQLFRTYATRSRGTFELVPDIPDLATLSPYFRARAVYRAQRDLTNALWPGDTAPEDNLRYMSVACKSVENLLSPEGIRSAGIRNVYVYSDEDKPTTAESWPDGTVRQFGGRATILGKTPETFWQVPEGQFQSILLLSASDFSDLTVSELTSAAKDFVKSALLAEISAGFVHMTLAETQLRDDFKFARFIGLHFQQQGPVSEMPSETLVEFRKDLLALGIPSSYGADPATLPEPAVGYWISTEPVKLETRSDPPLATFRQLADGSAKPDYQGLQGIAPGQAVRGSFAQERPIPGIDDANHLGVDWLKLDRDQDIASLSSIQRHFADVVILLPESLIVNPAVKNALKNELLSLAEDGTNIFLSLPRFVNKILPRSPEIAHDRRASLELRHLHNSTNIPQDQLIDDARRAWSYFEHWTDPETGLCPATVNYNPGSERKHESVTMWDVGSHINALISAVDLELISTKSFQKAVGRILPNLVGRNTDGRQLPSGWIRTDRFKWGNRDFDGCDCGRLLSSLLRLENHPHSAASVADLVASWDLEQIIVDGEIQNIRDRQLSSTFQSHCAHYAALAFRKWGLNAASPYEVFTGKGSVDGKLALLELAGLIGPIGAEPLLLEAIELGMTPESAYLADVLFAAQTVAHEKTGRIFCVSESPQDHAPWFTYQGLQINAPGIKWISVGVSSAATPAVAEPVSNNLLVSSKAAFLWAAYNPSDYSQRMLDYVRQRARGKIGFAPSVTEKTGMAPLNYSDINTNAIILQSISEMMKAI